LPYAGAGRRLRLGDPAHALVCPDATAGERRPRRRFHGDYIVDGGGQCRGPRMSQRATIRMFATADVRAARAIDACCAKA
jgi:hypothetical protein